MSFVSYLITFNKGNVFHLDRFANENDAEGT